MSFDLRPYVTIDPGEGQLAEGGPAAWENCTFAVLGASMKALGYGDPLEPQQMRDLVDPGSTGGEPWSASLQVLASRYYPDPPDARIVQPSTWSDLVAAVDGFGGLGFLVHWAGWCTPGGDWITTRPADGISHAGQILAFDGLDFTIWNPITGIDTMSAQSFRSSYDGSGILVIERSVTLQNQDVLDTLNLGTGVGEPDWPSTVKTTLALVQDLVNQVHFLQQQVASLTASVSASPPAPADVADLVAEVKALSAHLGVGTA